MAKLIIFNKPFQVLSQFTDDSGKKTLADYINVKAVYPAGRLDFDSEGLLLLTDDGLLQAKISDPKYKLSKTYWVQVEGSATQAPVRCAISWGNLKRRHGNRPILQAYFRTQPMAACAANQSAKVNPRQLDGNCN